MKQQEIQYELRAAEVADFILDVSTFLLASGAHSGRVERNIKRMIEIWGFEFFINMTFTGVLVTVQDVKNVCNTTTQFKKSPTHVVHFDIISRISSLSWKVHDEKLSLEEAKKLFLKIKQVDHYNSWVICFAVGASCAGLCFFSGGNYLNALVAFVGAFVGYRIRVWLTSLKYNLLIIVTFAAFVSTVITCIGGVLDIGEYPQAAVATAVLYLIPGVPLINSVIDLMEGYLSSAMNRMLFSGYNLLCIAVGMTICITLFGISNFV